MNILVTGAKGFVGRNLVVNLYNLKENKNRTRPGISIDEIYEQIWNEEAIGADNTVAVHIRHIREKIEINPREPKYLKVVWGVGYKIEKQ